MPGAAILSQLLVIGRGRTPFSCTYRSSKLTEGSVPATGPRSRSPQDRGLGVASSTGCRCQGRPTLLMTAAARCPAPARAHSRPVAVRDRSDPWRQFVPRVQRALMLVYGYQHFTGSGDVPSGGGGAPVVHLHQLDGSPAYLAGVDLGFGHRTILSRMGRPQRDRVGPGPLRDSGRPPGGAGRGHRESAAALQGAPLESAAHASGRVGSCRPPPSPAGRHGIPRRVCDGGTPRPRPER